MPTLELQAGGSLRIPMSFEEFRELDETLHTSFYDGLAVMNPPNRRHVRIARRLAGLLDESVPVGFEVLPEAGWLLDEGTVLVPDIMVASIDAPADDLLRVAPLLVVEVTARSTKSEDWGRKRELYAEGGADWYWIVDAEADAVSLFRNAGDRFDQTAEFREGSHLISDPFPTTLDLEALFA